MLEVSIPASLVYISAVLDFLLLKYLFGCDKQAIRKGDVYNFLSFQGWGKSKKKVCQGDMCFNRRKKTCALYLQNGGAAAPVLNVTSGQIQL